MLRWLREIIERFRNRGGDTGATGESAAAAWLRQNRGFVILARNWRSPRDRRREIDVVARDGEVLVFVEVKTRAAAALVPGYFAAVSPRKKKVLLQAARDYVARLRERPRTVRFDVVEVVAASAAERGAAPEVHHFENVPLFPKEYLRGG